MSCNLSCGFCHRGHGTGGVWDLDTSLAIIPQLKKLGLTEIILSGGEPLSQSWIYDLIYHLKNAGFSVDLCTNATLVNPTNAAMLSGLLEEISISLDSSVPQIHDRLRGRKGAWAKTLQGCVDLVNAGLDVHVISLVSSETVSGLEQVAALCEQLGVGSLAFIGKIPLNRKANWLAQPHVQSQLVEAILQCRDRYPSLTINTKRVLMPRQLDRCEAGASVFGLDARGNLLPCILLNGHAQLSVPIMSVEQPVVFDWRAVDTAPCSNCSSISTCTRGCPGSYYLQTGRLGPDTLCANVWKNLDESQRT